MTSCQESLVFIPPSFVNTYNKCFPEIFVLSVNVYSRDLMITCVSAEVLLDMRATGGELGWLTWPLDQGDKLGVSCSVPSSSFSSSSILLQTPAPTVSPGICLRINMLREILSMDKLTVCCRQYLNV